MTKLWDPDLIGRLCMTALYIFHLIFQGPFQGLTLVDCMQLLHDLDMV